MINKLKLNENVRWINYEEYVTFQKMIINANMNYMNDNQRNEYIKYLLDLEDENEAKFENIEENINLENSNMENKNIINDCKENVEVQDSFDNDNIEEHLIEEEAQDIIYLLNTLKICDNNDKVNSYNAGKINESNIDINNNSILSMRVLFLIIIKKILVKIVKGYYF